MIEEILQQCTVDGLVVRLPAVQLERDIYTKVADRLKKIGGKWKGGNVGGFVFDHDPTELLSDVQDGKKRNIKKEFQFFETPIAIVDQILDLADIQRGRSVLEPSAGRGAILQRCPYLDKNIGFYCYELNEQWHPTLEQYAVVVGTDFLKADPTQKFDRVIANPPFSNNQDIDHIRKMYDVLAGGGVMVSIASTHWLSSDKKKETAFREWLEQKGATIIPLPEGAFKESGTNIATVIIRIQG
jgi:hypothetical protein